MRVAAFLILLSGLTVFVAARVQAEELNTQERHALTQAYLEGNLEVIPALLQDKRDPEALLPLAILEHWWRAAGETPTATDPRQLVTLTTALTQRRYAWLASRMGGARAEPTSFPMAAEGEHDGWALLAALVEDRRHREAFGVMATRDSSVLGSVSTAMHATDKLGKLTESEKYELWWVDQARNDLSLAYDGIPDTDEQREAAQAATSIATRNQILAIVLLLLFCAVPIWIGRRRQG